MRAVDDPEVAGCCYDTLLTISDTVNAAVVRAIAKQLPELMKRQHEHGDRIADAAIVSDNPAFRAAAIRWRNFRREAK